MKAARAGAFRQAAALFTITAFTAGLAPAASAQQATARPEKPRPSSLRINHDPLACVNTELAPKVEAAVVPAPSFDKGYVYFKADGTEDFYYTPMRGTAEALEGMLPRPLPETKAIDYKVRARDIDSLNKDTREYVPPVIPGNACRMKGIAVGKGGAGLTIGLTRTGQNPVPPGFNKKDIAFVILTTGAVVALAVALQGAGAGAGAAAGAAGSGASGAGATGGTSGGTSGAGAGGGAAAGGGGISTAAIVVGGVLVAGGAVAIASSKKGSNNTATPVPTATSTPTSTRTPTPTTSPLQFVQAEVSWSGMGDIDLQILDSNNQPVGQVFSAGCESTSNRTERVLLQGTVAAGTYRVVLTGKSCGAGTPSSISAVVVVQTDAGPKCGATFINVPVPGTVDACTFTVP